MPQKSFASSLLKGLALMLGGGVALGVGIKIGQGTPADETADPEGAPGPTLEPVLERLSGIESRMLRMESALPENFASGTAAPGDPMPPGLGDLEHRLSSHGSEMETLRQDIREIDERSSERLMRFGQTVDELQSRLPALVEQTVGTCFQQMEEKLHREVEETHTRTLATFVDNIQTKVVQRISAFENDLAGQAEAMNQLREYSHKTDQNMQRLLVGVDRLASEIARKTEAPVPVMAGQAAPPPDAPEVSPRADRVFAEEPRPDPIPNFIPNSFLDQEPEAAKSASKWRIPLIFGIVVLLIAFLVGWQLLSSNHANKPALPTPNAAEAPPSPAPNSFPATPLAVSPPAGISPLESAREFARRKEYARAEQAYRSILQTDPQNREVVLGLADVLYRQQKYEESASVLKALSARPTP